MSADAHPYRRFWDTRDLDAWADALSTDVVLHSPLLERPFVGRAVAIDLFGSLLDAFDDFRITGEFVKDGEHVFLWLAGTGDREIEGVDVIRLDVRGDVAEMRVFVRPLVGLGSFSAVLGPPLARRRGATRGVLARLLGAPLRLLLKVIDVIATRLVQTR